MQTSDLREFCFSGDDAPEILLVQWMAAYLTREQSFEVKRLWAELRLVDGIERVTIDDMISIIETAKFLKD